MSNRGELICTSADNVRVPCEIQDPRTGLMIPNPAAVNKFHVKFDKPKNSYQLQALPVAQPILQFSRNYNTANHPQMMQNLMNFRSA